MRLGARVPWRRGSSEESRALIGVEHEYYLRAGETPVDFRALLPTLDVPGARLDPGEQMALLKSYEPQPGVANYAESVKRHDALQKAVAQINKLKSDDPAAFTIEQATLYVDAVGARSRRLRAQNRSRRVRFLVPPTHRALHSPTSFPPTRSSREHCRALCRNAARA